MPAHALKPPPCSRMQALLMQALLEGFVGERRLELGGLRNAAAFDEAWQAAWDLMISERAYPHRTHERRQWKEALCAARPEFRASYLLIETAYSRLHVTLLTATDDSRAPDDGVVMAELVA